MATCGTSPSAIGRGAVLALALAAAMVAALAAPGPAADASPSDAADAAFTDDPNAGADNSTVEGTTSQPGPIVIESVDRSIDVNDPELINDLEEVHDSFTGGVNRNVADPVMAWPPQAAVAGSGFSVTFDATDTPPANAQSVILDAAEVWDEALLTTGSGPVEIAVIWKNLGSPSLLGSAGPTALHSSAQFPTSSLYPTPLANAILGTDVNPGGPELTINLNSSPNWYYGSGTPGQGQTDLFTVVLHEIGHGLGFVGSASLSNGGGSTPALAGTSFVFDRAVTYNGAALLDHPDPNSLLTSDNLRIDISSGLDMKLHAPSTWKQGSSFSHFDESSYPASAEGTLMTPVLVGSQVERTLDGPVLGVLAGMGWPMRATAVTPSITALVPGTGQVDVQWSTNLANSGVAPDGYRVEAWRGTVLDASADVNAAETSVTLTGLQSGTVYTINVIPHADGINGTAGVSSFTSTGGPGAPAIVTAAGGGLTQTVSWTAAAGGGITGYTIERSQDGTTWHAAGTTTGLSLPVTVAEGIHQFRVRATNADGDGAWGYSIPAGVSAGIVRPVALDGQVARLYRAYFLRDPDAAGFAHWQGERADSASLAAISAVFAASEEFVTTYGQLSDTQFVELVYQNVLDRSADSDGLDHWVGVLGGGTDRGQVMIGFSESTEHIEKTGTVAPSTAAEDEVYRLYVASFLRFPDTAGFAYWSAVRAGGTSLEAIADTFAASAEFQTASGSLTDAAFVELVYNNVLGRSADSAGAAYWEGLLAAGSSRGEMMVGFSESPEFIITTGTLP